MKGPILERDFLASTLTLDASQPAPIYKQLHEGLVNHILEGRLSPGDRLPATRGLAKSLGISRNTVKLVYELLTAEGCLISRQGSGSFVAELENDGLQQALAPADAEGYSELRLARRAAALMKPDRTAIHGTMRAFQPGVPAVDLFPHKLWSRILSRRARHIDMSALGGAFQSSLPVLRRALSSYLSNVRGVRAAPEQVIVTPSAQAAIDLVTRLLLDPRDEVWIEDPCYIRAKSAFAAADAKLIPVSVDDDGMDPAKAPRSKPRLIYVTPSHHCPTGVTMPMPRRLQLLEAAKSANAFILEDDYDSEIHYDGRPIAALQGLDGNGRVLYVGTFSKTMMPALRAGYLVVPTSLVPVFEAAQRYTGHLMPAMVQAALAEFLDEGHYSSHIRKMRKVYSLRRQILIEGLARELPKNIHVHVPGGGLQMYISFTQRVDDIALADKLQQAGVGCLPVSRNYFAEPVRGLYLGFAAPDEDEIEQGVKTLTQVLKEVLS